MRCPRRGGAPRQSKCRSFVRPALRRRRQRPGLACDGDGVRRRRRGESSDGDARHPRNGAARAPRYGRCLLSARECADRRDIAGARRVLESQKAKIAALKVAAVTGGLVERLAHDLAVVLEGLANEDAYRTRGRQWMTSKMMGHQMQRCMEDSDSDEEESTGMPRLMGSVGRARNVYRNTSKKSSKAAMMRGMSARRPSAPQPTSATSSRPTSFPPPAPAPRAPRQGLFSSLFRKSQAPLEDQDLEE